MKSVVLCVLAVAMASGAASDYGYGRQYPRPRRGYHQAPQPHAMMFSGFYGQPSSFGHEGSMSAFANKDMVFTNSFAGEQFPILMNTAPSGHSDQDGVLPANVGLSEQENQDADYGEEPEVVPTTRKPLKQKKSKRKPSTTVKPIEEVDDSDEEDEEEQAVPLRGAQRPNEISPGNTYFPVVFGQGGGGRNGGGHPGAAVAIANAFSTGKGGVASSHATAYGDPYFSALAQRGNNGNRNKGKPKSR